jgi:hypothetical protein
MSAEQDLAKLTIAILPSLAGRERPNVPGFDDKGELHVLFNPKEYSIDRDTEYAEVPVPGLESPVLQYVRGGGDRMTFELFFDVTDNMDNGQVVDGRSVRELLQPLQQLMMQNERLHAPPPVQVRWGEQVVMQSAVAKSLSAKYTLFDINGLPVRATANLTLREHRSASAQLAEMRLQSPDLTNVAVVRQGDTLPALAFREYGDAALWRAIAVANDRFNPLDLSPGEELLIPKII